MKWKLPKLETVMSLEESSIAISKCNVYFTRIMQQSPHTIFLFLFLSEHGNDLVMGHHQHQLRIGKIVDKINDMIYDLTEKDLNKEFADFLVKHKFYNRRWQWIRHIDTIKTSFPNIQSVVYWKKILDMYKIFIGNKMNKNDLLRANGLKFTNHPLSTILSLKNIIRFEKEHSLGSAYGYALAMSNTNKENRPQWLSYIRLLRVLQHIYELDDKSRTVHIVISENLPHLYSE